MRLMTASLFVGLFASFGCGSGGTDDGAGGNASSGTSTSTGIAATCAGAANPETIKDGVNAMYLTAAGGKLYFIDAPTGVIGTNVDVMGEDGSGFTTLYQTTGNNSIGGLTVLSDGIYFFEVDETVPLPASTLKRIPLAGGAPTVVMAPDEHKGEMALLASNESSLFVSWTEVQGATTPAFIARFDLASSTLTTVEQVSAGIVKQMHLIGDTLYYLGLDASGMSVLYQIAASASMGSATLVGQVGPPTCQPALGVAITSSAMAVQCGIEMHQFDAMGMNPQTLLPLAVRIYNRTDGQYFYGSVPVGEDLGLERVPIGGGAPSLVTCADLPMAYGAVLSTPRVDSASQEFVFADGYLFWATLPGAGSSAVVRIHSS